MMKNIILLLVIAAFSFVMTACATIQKNSMPAFMNLPVITYGDDVPADNQYILYFPAGEPIATTVTIKGTAFSQQAEEILTVTLKKDIYEYKQWISFDGKNWIEGKEAIDFNIKIKVPGYGHPKPGLITVQMDMK